MNTKNTILQNCQKFLSARDTFAYRVCKAIRDGEFSDVLTSDALVGILNDGPGKHIKANSLTAQMQPLLIDDIVKCKTKGKGGNKRKFWYPGWVSTKHAESRIGKSGIAPKIVFPEKLIKALGREFKTELSDFNLNYEKSGTCTAFLLRKILEKLIFLSFAKNGLADQLKDADGDFLGLKKMLELTTQKKVSGKPFLMPKTKKEIEGIKFLGDTSAHNPLTNVEMRTIIPQMPFIVTAYQELVYFTPKAGQ